MTEHTAETPEPDDPHGAETGYEEAHSDEVDVEPGPKGPGSATGTGAGKTAGLPGHGYSPEMPDDETDDTIGGSEPYDDTQRRTQPFEERLDRED